MFNIYVSPCYLIKLGSEKARRPGSDQAGKRESEKAGKLEGWEAGKLGSYEAECSIVLNFFIKPPK
jgi:hypothetical protein